MTGRNLAKTKLTINPVLVDNENQLMEAIDHLLTLNVVGVDLESDMNKRYGNNLSLIQIGNEEVQYIIDPLNVDVSPLQKVIESSAVQKVFFDGHQDIQWLKREVKCGVTNLFDVAWGYQYVYKLANVKGLDKLVKEHFGVKLSKKYQRSDWSKRPLSSEQLHYSASDIAYLLPLRDMIQEEIDKQHQEEGFTRFFSSMELVEPVEPIVEERFMFLKFPNFHSYPQPLEKTIIYRLYNYRAGWGQDKNRPVFYLLGNRDIAALVDKKPKSLKELDILNIGKLRTKKEVAEDIVELIKQTLLEFQEGTLTEFYAKEIAPLEEMYQAVGRRNLYLLSPNLKLTIGVSAETFGMNKRRLKIWREKKAEELKLPKEFVLATATIKKLATYDYRRYPTLPLIPGLSKSFLVQFGEELHELLTQPPPQPYEKKSGRKHRKRR